VLYVSCEPETLARDLGHLELLGWAANPVDAFDMIPLSDALESLAVLEPRSAPPPRVLYEDAGSLALYKLPFEPTAAQGEADAGLLERARAGLGLPELTPVQRLDRGSSGVCWFARSPADAPPLARALEAAATTYLALASGVTHKKGKISRALPEGKKWRKALTRYRRLEVIAGHSLLEVELLQQGPKHQLRRHLASLGHPLLGDTRYGQAAANRHFEDRHGLDRQFVHCASVRLSLGASPIEVRAELPGDLAAVLGSLRAADRSL
jgi:23S rRNA (uracil1939-C5)-methyltransferase